jgi:hypothetical protein
MLELGWEMAKRLTPMRLDAALLKSLDRFVKGWNNSGAPKTNRTLVVVTAIEEYLKRWRPKLSKLRASDQVPRLTDRIVVFPSGTSRKRDAKNQRLLKQAL